MIMKSFRTYRDGLRISGKIYGEITPGKPKPAFILCHGFMANSSMCKGYAKLLAELGYLAFTFDFCGGGLISASQGKTTDMSVMTEVKDLMSVFSYVSYMEYVDSKRISLLGCSQGGFVCAIAAKQLKEKIHSLILLYPALCIPADARAGHMMFARFDPHNIPDTIRCGPMKLGSVYVTDVIDLNPYREIQGYEGPVLFLQGTEDNVVDPGYARRAIREYPDCTYHEIKGAGHMFRGEHDELAKQYIREFVSTH